MRSLLRAVPLLVAPALLLALPALSGGVTAISLPIAPNGDSLRGSVGQAVPLTPRTFLVASEGPDGSQQSPDDVVLFVDTSGPGPVVTTLQTPFLPDFSGRVVRFSATRAAVISAGPDDQFRTADDLLYLLDRLGSANTVTPITVGGLRDQDVTSPVPLGPDSALLLHGGADNTLGNADDRLLLLTDLGSANNIVSLPCPSPDTSGKSQPVVLNRTTVVVSSKGPDNVGENADDQLLVYTDLGGANTLTPLNTGSLPVVIGRPIPLGLDRLIVASGGADNADGTSDDLLLLISNVGTTNSVVGIPVPHLQTGSSGRPVPLDPNTVAVVTEGPDSIRSNADDTVAIVTGLGTTNTVTQVTIGGLREDKGVQPVRLTRTSFAITTGGAGGTYNNADDELVIVSGVGTTNALTRIPIPGLAESPNFAAVPLSIDAVLIANGGPNGSIDSGLDDQVSLITGIPGAPVFTNIPAAGEFRNFANACLPVLLGQGSATFQSSGPDGNIGSGGDDLIRIISGLPQVRGIVVNQLNLGFKANPNAKQTFLAKGRLLLDDASLLAGTDIAVSLGNAAQRLHAEELRVKANGTVSFQARRGAPGFVKSLVLNPTKRTFSITGTGRDTGVETTDPDYVPVAIEIGERLYLSELLRGRAVRNGIRFRR